jgi:maleate cis-trans isomerase
MLVFCVLIDLLKYAQNLFLTRQDEQFLFENGVRVFRCSCFNLKPNQKLGQLPLNPLFPTDS